MTEPLVKICGLQGVEVLKSMNSLPLDYVGLMFAPSRRRVTEGVAAELVAELGNWKSEPAPRPVGVFVNPGLSELAELLRTVPLDVVQLHGQESPQFCAEVKAAFPQVKVWKALSVAGRNPDAGDEVHTLLDSYAGTIDALLLDTYDPQERGGTGRTFDWEQIPLYQQAAAKHALPLFIAGGLHPDNVNELLDGYAPYGVDVSSGVETSGSKDIAKMTAFVERVKQS